MANEVVISEANLKLAVSEYLEYGTNQGRWYADQLNSGEIIVMGGSKSRRRIKLCREGTGDFIILKRTRSEIFGFTYYKCGVIFLELKSARGKTSPAQNAFKLLVEAQGASYAVVRSIEELEEILK